MSAFHIGSSSDSPVVSRSQSPSQSPRKVNESAYKFDRLHGTPTLQILFFHGLQFEDSLDAYVRNWESRDRSVIWPEKWLIEDFPTAEILYISYVATVKKGSDLNGRPSMYTIAENLMSDLIQAKVGQIMNCSVLLVGYCFGGIVIKELCLHAHQPRNYPSKHQMFLENIKGIFYFNTPHHGSCTFEEVGDKEHPLWPYFRVLSIEGARLDHGFDPLCKSNGWHIGGIGARLPVESGRFQGLLVVEESSARGGNNFTMREADHFEICKPKDKSCSGYYELVRLLETIQSSTPKISIDLDKVTKKDESYYMVPCLQISEYVERIELLESVKSAVQQRREQQKRQVVILLGMGGQGKSQLALEYCRTARLSKEFRAIFWIDAFSIKSTHQSFERIALKIADLSRVSDSIEEKIIFVKDTIDSWDSHWLLVFDNYDTPSTDFNVATFFPSSRFGTILVTTRHEDLKRLGKVIPVAEMTEQESLQLLFHRYENELTGENMEIGKSIVAKLQFLPLAIDQASAFMSARKLPLPLFLERFELQKEVILKYTPSLTEYRRILGDEGKEIALNVFTTWELSFHQIRKDETGERLRSFLTMATFFSSQDIGEDLFRNANDLETVPSWIDAFISEGAWDSIRYETFLAKLAKLSLLNFVIDEDTKQCRCYLHPMIADWLKLQISPDNRRQCTIESSYLLAKLIESTDLNSCSYAFRLYLLAHVDECFSNRRAYLKPVDEDVRFVKILIDQFGKLLEETSRYIEAISLVEESLPILETAYGKDHESTLDTVTKLGELYEGQGKLATAEEMFNRSLAGKEKALGKDHLSTLRTVNLLGKLYGDQSKLAEAEEMFDRALAGYEKALGKDHTFTLNIVHHLGYLYKQQGKFAASEDMLKRVLAGNEMALGKDHQWTLTSVQNLGGLYLEQGKLAAAEEMYNRALVGKEKALGKDHAHTLNIVNHLGGLYLQQGKLAAAEDMLNRCLVGYEKDLGKDHAWTLNAVIHLSDLYRQQGELAAAEDMLNRALVGYEKALGKDHAFTLTSVNNLGSLNQQQGKLAAAEEMLNRAFVGYEKTLGKDHAWTLTCVSSLGHLYLDQGKLAAAEEMYNRALAGMEKALGKDHGETLETVSGLGHLYLDQGKLAAAEEMYNHALAGREKALGKDHKKTLDTVYSMAMLMEK